METNPTFVRVETDNTSTSLETGELEPRMNHPHPSGFIVANGTVGVKEPNVTRFLTSVPGRVVKLVVLTYEKGRQSSLGTSSSGKCPRSFHWQEPLSRLYSSAYKMFGLAASPNAIGYDVIG